MKNTFNILSFYYLKRQKMLNLSSAAVTNINSDPLLQGSDWAGVPAVHQRSPGRLQPLLLAQDRVHKGKPRFL